MRDRRRSKLIARNGITVLRFWNHQIRHELDSVLKAIWFALLQRCLSQPSPPSSPFAKGRGEF
jgi:very-short-patch-repair endonuclease